jgi:hypothetical protein
VIRGHYDLAVRDMVFEHVHGGPGQRPARNAGKIVAVGIDIGHLVKLVRLVNLTAVQVNLFLDNSNVVAGQADHRLT